MPREAEGELRTPADGGHAARITLKGRGRRRTFSLRELAELERDLQQLECDLKGDKR